MRVLPIHVVKCEACGRSLQRKTYWRKPRCGPLDSQACYSERLSSSRRDEKAERKRLREQARRYRVLANMLGWKEDEFGANVRRLQKDVGEFRFYLEDLGVRATQENTWHAN